MSRVRRRLSRTQKRTRKLWITISIMLIVAFMFMYTGNGLYDSYEMKRQIVKLKKRNDSLTVVNEARQLKLDKLSSKDPYTLEAEARKEDVNMIFPNEQVFIISPEESKKQTKVK